MIPILVLHWLAMLNSVNTAVIAMKCSEEGELTYIIDMFWNLF